MLLEILFVLILAPAPGESGGLSPSAVPAPRKSLVKLIEDSQKRITSVPSGRVMLQVEVDCAESSVWSVVSKGTPRFPVSIVPISLKERPCFRVLVGDFPDERTALESVPLLPPGLSPPGNRPRAIVIATLGLKREIPVRDSSVPPPTVVETMPTPAPTVAPPVPRITPIVTTAIPVLLPTPMPEPTESPASATPPPGNRAPAPSPMASQRPAPTPPGSTPVHGPQSPTAVSSETPTPVGRATPTPASVASLQDFAGRVNFRKEGRKGSLTVSESGPGKGAPERSKAGPRSEPRISTITQEGPDSFGMIWVSGLVKNSGDAAACTIGVALTLLGPNNQVLGSAKAVAVQERLNPGESTGFWGAILPTTPVSKPVGSRPLPTHPHAEITTFTECP
jgi:hypothetical protein